MLKWAVGHRIPSSTSSTCSDIAPGVACCSSTFSQSTAFKLHPPSHQLTNVRTAYIRSLKTTDKENQRTCRKSLEKEMVHSTSSGSPSSTATIPSIHLDDIPAALRDVSNRLSGGYENAVERDTKPTKRNHATLKSISPRQYFAASLVSPVLPTAVAFVPHHTEALSKQCVPNRPDATNVTPSPARTTLKKKRPCAGHHHHQPILGASHSTNTADFNLFDNPQYFTLQTTPPEEPQELYHKELPVKRSRALPHSCDTLDRRCRCDRARRHACDIPEGARRPCEVSSLTSSLCWLKLKAALQQPTSNITPPTAIAGKSERPATTICRKASLNKRLCVQANENTPPHSKQSLSDSSTAASSDLDQPSTLKRQKVIRRKKRQNFASVPHPTVLNQNLKSVLTLPHGIPSPFHMNDTQFRVLARTPITTCTDIFFEATEDAKSNSDPRVDITHMLLEPTGPDMTAAGDIECTPKFEKDTKYAVSPAAGESPSNSESEMTVKAISCGYTDLGMSSVESNRSSNLSHIDDRQDGYPNTVSPRSLVSTSITDKTQARSRRCLSFVASAATPKSVVKPNRIETGQLDLRIYHDNGLLTVHIIRARNLHKILGELPCNGYVKVNLVPQEGSKTFHRTCVRKNSFNPKFDHKFLLEISESDLNKRVLISTWHRDRGKKKSEFLGCMSFAIKNILKKEINGTYKLLSHSSNRLSSSLSKIPQSQALISISGGCQQRFMKPQGETQPAKHVENDRSYHGSPNIRLRLVLEL